MKAFGMLGAAVAGAVGFAALSARGSSAPPDVYLTLTLQVDPIAQTWEAFGQVTGDPTQTSGLAGIQFNVTGAGGVQIGAEGVDTTKNDMPIGVTDSFIVGFDNQRTGGTFGVGITGAQGGTFDYETDSGNSNVLTGVGILGQTQSGVTWGLPVLLANGTYTGTSGSLAIWGYTALTTVLPAVLPPPNTGGGIQTFSPPVNSQIVQIPNTSIISTGVCWTGASSGTWNTTGANWSTTSVGSPLNAAWVNNTNRQTPNMAAFTLADPAPVTVTVDSNVDVGSILFSTYPSGQGVGAFTLAAGTGALAYGGTGAIVITTWATPPIAINALIADGSALGPGGGVTSIVKSGDATLILGGTNTYSGSTTILAGTLELNSVGALPVGSAVINNGTLMVNADTVTGPLTGSGKTIVAPGVVLVTDFSQGSLVNNGTVFVDGTPTIGSVSGSGALLFASRTGNVLTIASPNTGAGNVTINSGTLVVANATGSATGSGNVTLNGGTLGGYGTIAGAVIVGGGTHMIYPSVTLAASSAGTLTLGGLTTSDNTILNFNLVTPGASHSGAGSVNDTVNVAGNNGLTFKGGTVEFTNHSTGATSLGYYRIMGYSGAIGGGGVSSLDLPAVANDIAYTLDTTRDPGFIDVHRGLLGDANDDGLVNFADFVALSNDFGATNAGWSGGDFNGDGVVDSADFVTLSNNFGATIGPSEAAAGVVASGVPEPASLVLLGAGLAGAFGRRRRRDSGGKV